MQRDMKIGMALGVALVGIVGALFFRRDPEKKDPPPPPLAGAEEIDQEIAEKGKAPYIQGLDEFAEPAAAPPPSTTAVKKDPPKTGDTSIPGFLTREDEAEHRAFLSGKPSAPDPITATSAEPPLRRDTAAAPEPPPAHNRDWQPDGASVQGPGRDPKIAAPGGPETPRRTHVTRPGETLSGLAAHYLGSSARYREIYDANRNVLRSPDELPDGVTLVIPDRPRATGQPDTSHTAEGSLNPRVRKATMPTSSPVPAEKPAVTGEASPGKLRFAPVSRSPFSAGRTGARATPAAPSSAPAAPSTPPADKTPASPGKGGQPQLEFDDNDPF